MDCKNVVGDFLAYLGNYLDINPKIYELISPMLQVRELVKNEVIVNEGEICREAFWLQAGYGRYFKTITDENGVGHDQTIDFCKPGRFLFVSGSFFDESISEFGFELSAGSIIIPFTKNDYDSLIQRCPEVATIANKILVLDKFEVIRKMDMMKIKPRERYREFLILFEADIEQYFAIKHIANNLGLQPSYLSRLRGEFRKKKSGLTKYLQIVFITLHFI